MAIRQDIYREDLIRPSRVLLRSKLLVGAVTGLAVVLSLLAALAQDFLLRIDEPISEVIRQDELNTLFRWVTNAGSPNTAVILSVVGAVMLWNRCRAFAMALPATVAAGIAIDLALKALIDRPRPEFSLVSTGGQSFPSGHVIQVIIVFGLLVPAFYLITGRKSTLWASTGFFVVIVTGVAVSRVALGAHWPTDVVASAVIGLSLLLASELFVGSRFARRHCGGCYLHTSTADEIDLLANERTPP